MAERRLRWVPGTPARDGVIYYNDRPKRSFADIKRLLARAIALADADGF